MSQGNELVSQDAAERLHIKLGECVLEVGPGNGHGIEKILSYKPSQVLAIEISDSYRKSLKNKFENQNVVGGWWQRTPKAYRSGIHLVGSSTYNTHPHASGSCPYRQNNNCDITMEDYKGPLTSIDVRNTGFIGMDTLNKANVGPINPEKGWLVLWQEGRKDEIGNDIPASVSNVAILEKEVVVNEVLKCLIKYGLSKEFEITNNVLEHPKAWRIWDEALKRYESVRR